MKKIGICKHVFAWSTVLLAVGNMSVRFLLRTLAQTPTAERSAAERARQCKAARKIGKRLVTAGTFEG